MLLDFGWMSAAVGGLLWIWGGFCSIFLDVGGFGVALGWMLVDVGWILVDIGGFYYFLKDVGGFAVDLGDVLWFWSRC